MQLCCTNMTVQRLLWYRAPWQAAAPSTDLNNCAGAKRKESRNGAHLQDRFCLITPWITFRMSRYALPTVCFVDFVSSLYSNSWSASPGTQIPLTVLLLQTQLSRIPINNPTNHESNGLNLCSSKNEQILTRKVGAKSCAIWHNSWFHHWP